MSKTVVYGQMEHHLAAVSLAFTLNEVKSADTLRIFFSHTSSLDIQL
jgi:hypothetical protein